LAVNSMNFVIRYFPDWIKSAMRVCVRQINTRY
jgi:hypothetical protein